MADKAIGQLNAATAVQSVDLFVLEQNGEAKKLTGQILENWLVSFADGHGGIQTIEKTSSSGTNPVVDTYTITLSDETEYTFDVTNGVKGDTGAQTYVWIKYSAEYPDADSDMGDSPDDYIGVYVGLSSTAPTHYTDYMWFKWKGETGQTGAASTITSQSVTYQEGQSGTVAPSGSWTPNVPSVTQGNYLWTKTELNFNDGTTVTAYSVTRMGVDGTGSVSSVNNVSPDGNGNVAITATSIPMSDNQSIQSHVADAETDIANLETSTAQNSGKIEKAEKIPFVESFALGALTGNQINKAVKVRVISYNVAKYNNDTATTMPNEKVQNFRNFLDEANPDYLCAQEDANYYDNSSKGAVEYLYNPVLPEYYRQGTYYDINVHSKQLASASLKVKFTGVSSTSRAMEVCVFPVNNSDKKLLVCSVHCPWADGGGSADSATNIALRNSVYTEIFQFLNGDIQLYNVANTLFDCPSYDYAVVCMDANCITATDKSNLLAAASAKNFTAANGGKLGWFKTCQNTDNTKNALDNIFVSSGVVISDIQAAWNWYDRLYSDHVPLICDLMLNDADSIGKNNALWTGSAYPGNITLNLSGKVSDQLTGIVLCWSEYSSGSAKDAEFNYSFVPKSHVASHSGKGIGFFLIAESKAAYKYLYIYDDHIVGYSGNDSASSTGAGINFTNNFWVLREVIGI